MTLQLTFPNMACSACSGTITEAIQAVSASRNFEGTDLAATVQADTKTKQVNIETQAAEVAIKQAITDAGYTVA
ncbi:MAG: heavy-metal-associated domain-containing protein [Leptolyngbyaceae cyanobacterium RM1_406_9]|nr:heavy-metal-associated domain-containing protein [Leptolyngbyaceae cyanobacterium RM1_406_9]